MTEKEKIISTKDQWTIIAMAVCSHAPVKIEPLEAQEGRSITLVYHFGEDAREDHDKWMRGVAEEPFITLRRVQQANTQFKNNLHRYSR